MLLKYLTLSFARCAVPTFRSDGRNGWDETLDAVCETLQTCAVASKTHVYHYRDLWNFLPLHRTYRVSRGGLINEPSFGKRIPIYLELDQIERKDPGNTGAVADHQPYYYYCKFEPVASLRRDLLIGARSRRFSQESPAFGGAA